MYELDCRVEILAFHLLCKVNSKTCAHTDQKALKLNRKTSNTSNEASESRLAES